MSRFESATPSSASCSSSSLSSFPSAPSSRSGYGIGIVTALSIERLAMELCLDARWDRAYPHLDGDRNVYTYGRIGQHPVVIISLAGVYGETAASEVSTHLLRSHPNIREVLMVGIGGGVPHPEKHDIRLGDVVISAGPVWQHDFGKLKSDGTVDTTGHLPPPSPRFRSLLESLLARDAMEKVMRNPLKQLSQTLPSQLIDEEKRKHFSRPDPHTDVLYAGDDEPSRPVERKPRADTAQPHIHYGIIATGNVVLKSSVKRNSLRDYTIHGDVLCVEMEAAGVAHISHGQVGYLVIRGICDYADSHKNKEWQGHAAVVASAMAKILMLHLSRPTDPSTDGPVPVLAAASSFSPIPFGQTEQFNSVEGTQWKGTAQKQQHMLEQASLQAQNDLINTLVPAPRSSSVDPMPKLRIEPSSLDDLLIFLDRSNAAQLLLIFNQGGIHDIDALMETDLDTVNGLLPAAKQKMDRARQKIIKIREMIQSQLDHLPVAVLTAFPKSIHTGKKWFETLLSDGKLDAKKIRLDHHHNLSDTDIDGIFLENQYRVVQFYVYHQSTIDAAHNQAFLRFDDAENDEYSSIPLDRIASMLDDYNESNSDNEPIKCAVMLGCCCSESFIRDLTRSVDYVITSSDLIDLQNAASFITAFYRALLHPRSINHSVRFAWRANKSPNKGWIRIYSADKDMEVKLFKDMRLLEKSSPTSDLRFYKEYQEGSEKSVSSIAVSAVNAISAAAQHEESTMSATPSMSSAPSLASPSQAVFISPTSSSSATLGGPPTVSLSLSSSTPLVPALTASSPRSASSAAVAAVVDVLAKHYAAQSELIMFSNHRSMRIVRLKIDRCYIKLHLVTNNTVDASQQISPEDLLLRRVSAAAGSSNMDTYRVLINGEAGSGKSTLLHCMAYRWALYRLAQGHNSNESTPSSFSSLSSPLTHSATSFDHFDAVIWLPLRKLSHPWNRLVSTKQFKGTDDLIRFIYYCSIYPAYHTLPSSIQRILMDYLSHLISPPRSQRVLFLLDGYDEVEAMDLSADAASSATAAAQLNSDVLQKLKTQSYLILTTRPYANARRSLSFDVEARVMEFKEADIDRYVESYFAAYADQFPQADRSSACHSLAAVYSHEVVELVKQHQHISAICRIPINLFLVCCLWIEAHQRNNHQMECKSSSVQMHPGTSLKSLSATQLYRKLICWILRRAAANPLYRIHIAADDDNDDENMPIIINESPSLPEADDEEIEAGEVFQQLELIAYEGMRARLETGDTVIKKSVIERLRLTSCMLRLKRTGLIQLAGDVNLGDCQFPHLTFQEYFAASYLHRQLSDTVKSEAAIHAIIVYRYGGVFERMFSFLAALCLNDVDTRVKARFLLGLTDEPIDLIGLKHMRNYLIWTESQLDTGDIEAQRQEYENDLIALANSKDASVRQAALAALSGILLSNAAVDSLLQSLSFSFSMGFSTSFDTIRQAKTAVIILGLVRLHASKSAPVLPALLQPIEKLNTSAGGPIVRACLSSLSVVKLLPVSDVDDARLRQENLILSTLWSLILRNTHWDIRSLAIRTLSQMEWLKAQDNVFNELLLVPFSVDSFYRRIVEEVRLIFTPIIDRLSAKSADTLKLILQAVHEQHQQSQSEMQKRRLAARQRQDSSKAMEVEEKQERHSHMVSVSKEAPDDHTLLAASFTIPSTVSVSASVSVSHLLFSLHSFLSLLQSEDDSLVIQRLSWLYEQDAENLSSTEGKFSIRAWEEPILQLASEDVAAASVLIKVSEQILKSSNSLVEHTQRLRADFIHIAFRLFVGFMPPRVSTLRARQEHSLLESLVTHAADACMLLIRDLPETVYEIGSNDSLYSQAVKLILSHPLFPFVDFFLSLLNSTLLPLPALLKSPLILSAAFCHGIALTWDSQALTIHHVVPTRIIQLSAADQDMLAQRWRTYIKQYLQPTLRKSRVVRDSSYDWYAPLCPGSSASIAVLRQTLTSKSPSRVENEEEDQPSPREVDTEEDQETMKEAQLSIEVDASLETDWRSVPAFQRHEISNARSLAARSYQTRSTLITLLNSLKPSFRHSS